MKRKAKISLKPGRYVWISCEVKPGPFSDERMVKAVSAIGGDAWVGFAPVSALKDPVVSGATLIKALVVQVNLQKDLFDAQPLGSPLTHTLVKEKVSLAELVA